MGQLIEVKGSDGKVYKFKSCVFSGELHDGGGITISDAPDLERVQAILTLMYYSIRKYVCDKKDVDVDLFDEKFKTAVELVESFKRWEGGEMSEKTTH